MLDALRTLRLSGGIFVNAHFTSPWCIADKIGPEIFAPHSPIPKHIIAYHYVAQGNILVKLKGQPTVTAHTGDIVVLPRNQLCLLGSTLGIPPVNVEQLIQARNRDGLFHMTHGGGGERTHLICGYLGSDDPHSAILTLLPNLLVINVSDGVSGSWVETNIKYAAQELMLGKAASPVIVGKLAELLFMEAVRRFVATGEREPFRGQSNLQDPLITRALGLLHNQLNKRWTSDELGGQVGLSRSAFADRFTRLIGIPPMQYLTQQRLETAKKLLGTSIQSVARIAYLVGYESEAAFSRAFKRAYGQSPGAWRRQTIN